MTKKKKKRLRNKNIFSSNAVVSSSVLEKKQLSHGQLLKETLGLYQQGNVEDALLLSKQGLIQFPDDSVLLIHAGAFSTVLGHHHEALNYFQRSLAIDSFNPDAHNNLGNLFKKIKRFEDAEIAFLNAIKLRPNHAEAYNNLGNLLEKRNCDLEAEAAYQNALLYHPDYADAHNNLGHLYRKLGRLEEAEVLFKKAIKLCPNYVDAYVNLGNLLKAQKRFVDSEAAYQNALKIDPCHIDAHFNLSLLLLSLGRFKEGWDAHEFRYYLDDDNRQTYPPDISTPLWQGESLTDKSLFLWPEQGIGDEIMFASCINDFKYFDSKITLACEARLQNLFRRSFPFINVITKDPGIRYQDLENKLDYHCGIGSLPRFFRKNIKDFKRVPNYLIEEQNLLVQWQERYKQLKYLLNIGISWRGGKDVESQEIRSVSLQQWRPIFECEANFINLQYGNHQSEIDIFEQQTGVHLHDWKDADPLSDLDNFAAQIKALDLVISIDNSTVHFSGALGVKTFVMLPYEQDWRWMEGSADCLWYPNVMTLFQRRKESGWATVIQGVVEEIKSLNTQLKNMSSCQSSFFSGLNLDEILNKILAIYQKGNVKEALLITEQAITEFPEQSVLFGNAGAFAMIIDDQNKAVRYLQKSIKLNSNNADVHNNLACLLKKQNRFDEAETSLLLALKLRPDFVEAHDNLADLLMLLKRYDQAEVYYNNAIRYRPDYVKVHNDLGNLYLGQRRYQEAELSYQKALSFQPNSSEILNNLGSLFKAQKRDQDAEVAYQNALNLQPDYVDANYNLGNLFKSQKRYRDAEICFQNTLIIRPDFVEVHFNLGYMFNEQKRYKEAESCYLNALKYQLDYVDVYVNLGALMQQQKRYKEAENFYQKALKFQPDNVEVYVNLGDLLKQQRQFKNAEVMYQKALEAHPEHARANFNLAILLLTLGRFKEGWRSHEFRYKLNKQDRQTYPPDIGVLQWQGELLKDKSLLIWPEQGFGDAIQFVRYLFLLKEQGLKYLVLVCKKPLVKLFNSLECVDRVISLETFQAEDVDGVDYWSFIMSLPLHFKTTLETIPANIPYLSCSKKEQKQWADFLPLPSLRIGLVWKGSVTHTNDANRSLSSLEVLDPLWSLKGVVFIGLQKDISEKEACLLASLPIINLGDKINDFADTAAIISQLDLVISVDTSIAHLAGALNKPCWVLLPGCNTDWRWLDGRNDSPWYPSVMKLFRQRVEGDWASVIDDIRKEIISLT